MTTIVLGPCECCRKQQAEWQSVNTENGLHDLCGGCFQEVRDIYKRHPAKSGGKRCKRELRDIACELIELFRSKQPNEQKDELSRELEALLNA